MYGQFECIVQRPKPSKTIIYLNSVRKIHFYLFFRISLVLCLSFFVFFFDRRLYVILIGWFFCSSNCNNQGADITDTTMITTTKIALLLAFPLRNRTQSEKMQRIYIASLRLLASIEESPFFSISIIIALSIQWEMRKREDGKKRRRRIDKHQLN